MTDEGRKIEIPGSLAGERLDRALAMLTSKSRSETARTVAAGCVRVEGVTTRAGSQRLWAGAVVEVLPEHVAEKTPPSLQESAPLDILFFDGDIVVVNKPSGVVTHRGAGHDHGTLADALIAQFPEMADVGQPDRPGIVHRLDRGTSGALVCARTDLAYDSLVDQLSKRHVRRTYAALTRNHPPSPRGTIDAPIGRDRNNRTKMAVMSDGRDARTHYSTVETFTHPVEASLLRCELETGRTHQIRVHLASIGLPLLGDLTYGVPDPFGIARPLLHAAIVEFGHPATGTDRSFTAPMPDDFASALTGFGSSPSAFATP